MSTTRIRIGIAVSIALLASGAIAAETMQKISPEMSFFVTSAGLGKGADLGGLAGADRHCQQLAAAAGAGKKQWRAYLSTTGDKPVHARDRIGKGPWYTAEGRLVARNVDELHASNSINRMTALTEKGARVNGRADSPNMHDILTGSGVDGRAVVSDKDTTCGNWTKSGDGAAMVGHHDRWGLKDDEPSRSWNASHPSRGCSQDNLRASGGAGMFYCFAVNTK
ncbi:MAG: hypothetical protein OEV67_09350 [Betaproteobacteria bacterium]|jgi:hypothetical protein|nr:hypothetical protein [Betaproteobacteria bacterium]